MLEAIVSFLLSMQGFVVACVAILTTYALFKSKPNITGKYLHLFAQHYKDQTILVPGPDRARASRFTENPDPHKFLLQAHPDVKTVYDVFLYGNKISNSGPCLGHRSSSEEEYQWISYQETIDRSKKFGHGLTQIGIQPGQDSLVGIYGVNCPEWSIAGLGLTCQAMVVVPLYDTLGTDSAVFILNQCQIKVAICDTVARAQKLIGQIEKTPSLKHIVIMQPEKYEWPESSEISANIQLHKFREIENLGRVEDSFLNLPKPEDLYMVCYTSGTTGNPKGAMITHANCMAATAMFVKPFLEPTNPFRFTPADSLLSYLPLAHIFQQLVHIGCHFFGMRIGFYQGDVKKVSDDLQALKPNFLPAVPRVLTRIYDGVLSQLEKVSPLRRAIFWHAYNSKLAALRNLDYSRDTIWDKIVFNKIRRKIGLENVGIVVVGAAPISSEVLTMCRVIFGCLVAEGYGQTECTAGCSATLPGDLECGHVGAPAASCLVKLTSVPEMGYEADSDEGEICIYGPIVMKGYYKEPEKTREAIDSEGWLHTGDIGKWSTGGRLKIIDRKKDIFKLSQGEYVAPAKIEAIYQRCHVIGQVFIEGNSLRRWLVGIVAPDKTELIHLSNELGIHDQSFEQLCENPKVVSAVLELLRKLGTDAKLNSFEQVKAIHLTPKNWTVSDGLLTPTEKNKRPQLRKYFAEAVEKLYEQIED